MFGIGMPELLVILVIVLVIFGANKLPPIGEGLGKGIRNFKKSTKEVDEILSGILSHGKVSLAFVPYIDQFPIHLLKGKWDSPDKSNYCYRWSNHHRAGSSINPKTW